jgi:hypothetical protein
MNSGIEFGPIIIAIAMIGWAMVEGVRWLISNISITIGG